MIDTLRRVQRLAAMTATALLLASCSSAGSVAQDDLDATATPARGGTLHLADEGEAISLNPFVAQDNNSQRVFAQVLEPLFRTDGDGEVVPWLVERSKPSKDFKSWTFELRPEVKFSDGTPMTASDVVFSLDSVRKAPSWSTMFSDIKSVEASSPTTVEVTTSTPSPALETNLSLPFAVVVPEDLGGMTPEEFGRSPIGTGPFEVESWHSGQQITLVRNESYWDPKRPFLDKVVVEAVTSDSSRAQQLRGEALDLAATPPLPQLETLGRAPDTKVGEYALAFPNYLLLNQKSAHFADPRVREAADLAVDRESIVKAATSEVGELGGSFLSPALEYHDKSIEPVRRNTERATQLLDQAVTDGVDPSFTLKIAAGDSYQSMAAQIIEQNLEDVGFSVSIKQFDGSAVLSQVAAGNYDATMFTMTSDIVDPAEVIGFYLDLNALWTGGETDEVSKLLKEAIQEPDEAARRDLYGQIQQVVLKDRSLVVLGYQPWIWAMQEDVVGFDLPPTGVPWLADVGFRAE